MRVLVVEDSWHVARAIKSALDEMGMVVAKPAATLATANRLIAEHIFDLAVVDINLKGEMSYDLIDRLRDRGRAHCRGFGLCRTGEVNTERCCRSPEAIINS